MALIDELKERREAVANRLEDAYVSTGNLRAELNDLDSALAALSRAHDFVAEQETAREQLKREPEIPDGYTVWDGGECPVDPAALVCVVTRSGSLEQFHAGTFSNPDVLFDQWQWSNYRRQDDIIAYRIIEASAQEEVVPFASEPELAPVPGAGEESRDQSDDDTPAEHISILTGDPAIEPESGLHGEAIVARQSYMDGDQLIVHEITASEFLAPPLVNVTPEEAPALNADMHDEREQPVQTEPDGYAPVTNPEADALARAHDWYDPKAVAERNRFNPFGMFKREDA